MTREIGIMKEQLITRQAVQQVLRDYGQQYKTHSWYAGVGFFLPALGNILGLFVPPLIVARVIDIFVTQGGISLSAVAWHVALFGAVWLLGESFWRVGMYFIIKMEAKGINNLSRTVFRRLVERDYDFYANNFVGSLTKKGLAFGRSFEMFTDTLVFNVTTNILPLLFVVVVLWQYSPWIPAALMMWIAIALTVGIPIIRKRSYLVALRHDASSRVAGRLSDSMTNILAIKSFAKEDQEHDSYGNHVNDFAAKFKKAADYQNLRFDLIMSPIYVATNVTGLILAIYFAQQLALQAGMIFTVFAYYALVPRVFWDMNRVYRNIESSISEAAEFTQLFLAPPAVQDMPAAKDLKVAAAGIQFNRINFRYSDDRREGYSFLRDFSLDIQGNQKVGLVGPSGSGKTTITKLLLRFVDLQSGTIAIDGQDIRKVTQASLRRAIAYVPQEPLLFHRTLFENIAYGHDEVTQEEVMDAAKLAHAHEFIAELPDGYQTLVGERGIKLSGGQRQRIAIARALLKESPILVLDEATSSLDSESEKYIQEGLQELMKEKTALVIAHRLSTIKNLDRIIVLDQGKIVQDGTHEELLRQRGMYANLWSHQAGDFLRYESLNAA
ncbi:MAG: ABC transporter ATP-binding protein [Candidatus Yanofskybacteria bacterium]|nr:ABC transporter ATP-binding protein [Candidatus Yanofskybacteria bacterium]